MKTINELICLGLASMVFAAVVWAIDRWVEKRWSERKKKSDHE